MLRHYSFIILYVIVFGLRAEAQVKTNMQLFETLIDSSVINMENDLQYSKSDNVICILPSETQTLSAYTVTSIKKHTRSQSTGSVESRNIIFTIEDMQVQYPEIGRYSFLGENFLVRKATLRGSVYTSSSSDNLTRIAYTVTDTIPLSEKDNVELQNSKFTTAALPTEPFFSSLFEPVIGVAAIAVTTYLLFTVRKTN